MTEPSYILGFVRKTRNATVEVRILPEHGDPRKLVEMAKKERDQARKQAEQQGDEFLKYEEVWCVFDRDQHERFEDACQMARDNRLELAVSNPSFELWLLLHFRESPGAQHRQNVRKMLQQFLPGYDKHVDFELVAGRVDQAIERARRLDQVARQRDPARGLESDPDEPDRAPMSAPDGGIPPRQPPPGVLLVVTPGCGAEPQSSRHESQRRHRYRSSCYHAARQPFVTERAWSVRLRRITNTLQCDRIRQVMMSRGYVTPILLWGTLSCLAAGCARLLGIEDLPEQVDAGKVSELDASMSLAPDAGPSREAAKLIFDCVADTTAHANAIDANFGSELLLDARRQGTDEATAYLRFDPFAGGIRFARIDHAFLILTPEQNGYGYGLVETLGPWQEGALTWRNKSSTRTDVVQPLRGVGTEVIFDVTEMVRQWNEDPGSNYGVAIIAVDDYGEPVRFFSRESDVGAPRLELIVNSDTMALPLSGDTYVDQDQPGASFGDEPVLTYVSGNSSEGYSRLLVQADLSNLSPDLDLFRAELVLQQLDGTILNSGHVHIIEAAWSETAVTWDSMPTFTAEAFTVWPHGSATGAQELRWDLTQAARQWLQSPQSNHGVVIRDSYEGPAGASRIATLGSREHPEPALRPRIQLYFGDR